MSGCMALTNSAEAACQFALTDAGCLTLLLVEAVRALGMRPSAGGGTITPDMQIEDCRYATRDACSRKAYYRCLLNLPKVWAAGNEVLDPKQPQMYYELILRGQVVQPGLGDRTKPK